MLHTPIQRFHRFYRTVLLLSIVAPWITPPPALAQGVCGADLSTRAKRGVVQLLWSPVAGAESYRIGRAPALAGPFLTIGETTSTYATYLDRTAPTGALQYYRFTALDAAGSALCVSPVVAALVADSRTRMVVVPDVIGNPQPAAEAMLAAARLTTGAVSTVPDGTVAPGTVVGQDPPAGSFVPRNSAVAITVAVAPPPVDACAGFIPQPTTCGVGACAATGETTCTDVGGQALFGDTCVAGTPTAEMCDGLDNDCDGTVDNGIGATPTQCGVGACASTGELACVGGQMVDSCVAGNATAEVCDGLDNDCNGAVDNGIGATPTQCGVGACAATGELACVGGQMVDSCVAGNPSTEVCTDGVDNDCDGLTDSTDVVDCPPVSVCDGFVPASTTCGVGACAATGQTTCTDVGGAQVIGDTCVAGTPSAEVCDGLDNDCDGAVDDGIGATPTQCGVGACAATGELACVGGQMVDSCVAGNPIAEVCDGLDNDCDGTVDNGIGATPTQCGVGACAATGELACVGGQMVDSCVAGTPSAEVCDGLDNDCDGTVDDGIAATPTQCGAGACAATGELACVGGQMVDSCTPGNPSPEVCDGVDNNCDGTVDNGFGLGTACTAGVGACEAAGVLVCAADASGTVCDATPGAPGVEGPTGDPTCSDGIDNDCNGTVDAADPACAPGPPASAILGLSNDIIPTQAAGGSVDATCRVFDAAGVELVPTPPVTLSTGAADAVVSGGNNFAFPTTGEPTVTCTVDGTAIADSRVVIVYDDFIDPLFSALSSNLADLDALLSDATAAVAAEDLAALQSAKDAIVAEVATVNLAGLAAVPPVLTGGDVPTDAQLLTAGDTPDPAKDDPFKATIQAIEQNLIDYNNLLASITPATATQADVDQMNALTTAGQGLAATLEGLADPSQTAVLAVNNALNNIVSNLIPNQAVDVAQYAVGIIDTIPGIAGLPPGLRWNLLTPAEMFAGFTVDLLGPAAYYAQADNAQFLVGLLMSQSIANGLRSQYIKRVYKPIMKHIAKNMAVLRQMNLLPSGLDPPLLDFVFGGGGGATSTIFEGGEIWCWGSNFDPIPANNTIRIIAPNGTFDVTPDTVQKDSSTGDIMHGFLPFGMSGHTFGLPGAGLVRIITAGGTSGDVAVNIFR